MLRSAPDAATVMASPTPATELSETPALPLPSTPIIKASDPHPNTQELQVTLDVDPIPSSAASAAPLLRTLHRKLHESALAMPTVPYSADTDVILSKYWKGGHITERRSTKTALILDLLMRNFVSNSQISVEQDLKTRTFIQNAHKLWVSDSSISDDKAFSNNLFFPRSVVILEKREDRTSHITLCPRSHLSRSWVVPGNAEFEGPGGRFLEDEVEAVER
jgi:hypothetical protein